MEEEKDGEEREQVQEDVEKVEEEEKENYCVWKGETGVQVEMEEQEQEGKQAAGQLCCCFGGILDAVEFTVRVTQSEAPPACQSSALLPSCSFVPNTASTSDEPAAWRSTAAAPPPPTRRGVASRREIQWQHFDLVSPSDLACSPPLISSVGCAGGDEAPLCNHRDLRAARPGEHILQLHVHLSGTLRVKLLCFFFSLPFLC